MPGIQPHNLTNEELERHIYTMLDKPVPAEWVAELLARFTALLDEAAQD